MIGTFVIWLINFLILWLGIKFLSGPIGGSEIDYIPAALMAIIIWFAGVAFGYLVAGVITG